jgi:SAM-dependent methyltransferase
MQITPALKTRLGYGEVRGCYYGPLGTTERKIIESEDGEIFECEVDLFDAERDAFPYPCEHFDTVLCCELIEHLPSDPMHMMSEINRILRPGGSLVLTTPNIVSTRAISAILQGYHPGFCPACSRVRSSGNQVSLQGRRLRHRAFGNWRISR